MALKSKPEIAEDNELASALAFVMAIKRDEAESPRFPGESIRGWLVRRGIPKSAIDIVCNVADSIDKRYGSMYLNNVQ